MKRKVIQISAETFVITLPRQFVRAWGLGKGMLLDVQTQEDALIVRPERIRTLMRAAIPSELLTQEILDRLFQAGFDEVIIKDIDMDKLMQISPFEIAYIDGTTAHLHVAFDVQENDLVNLMRQIRYLCRQFPIEEIRPLLKERLRTCHRMLGKFGHPNRASMLLLHRSLIELEHALADGSFSHAAERLPGILLIAEESTKAM